MVRDFLLAADPAAALDRRSAPGAPVAPPATAATVMLVRDDTGPLEVFMLRRAATMAFAASRHVFPGGGVDHRDSTEVPWAGPSAKQWASWLGCDESRARQVLAAAVRELFEETGVLLAGPPDSDHLADLEPALADGLRSALATKESSLAEVLIAHQLVMRTDLLRHTAHWITPEIEPRRYDTYFFVAALPPGAQPDGRTSEADLAEWVRPARLLASFAGGDAALLPPTIVALEELDRSTVAEYLDGVEVLTLPRPVVLPTVVSTAAGPAMRIDDEPAPVPVEDPR